MLIAIWPLIICIAGLVLYLAATNAKPIEIGRLMFAIGLFWLTYDLVSKTFHLGG